MQVALEGSPAMPPIVTTFEAICCESDTTRGMLENIPLQRWASARQAGHYEWDQLLEVNATDSPRCSAASIASSCDSVILSSCW